MARPQSVTSVTRPRTRGTRKVPRQVREREMLHVAERAFAARGFHAASVDAIADGAGITKPMVYAYFGSKEGLYRACMARARERLFEILRDSVDTAAPPDASSTRFPSSAISHTPSPPTALGGVARRLLCSTRLF